MRYRSAIAVGLLIAAAVNAGGFLASRAEEARTARRAALVIAVDDLWLEALALGADLDRWPEVQFAALGSDLAETRCTRPRPVIVFNEDRLAEYEWYMPRFAVPHELAHVMDCLDGGLDTAAPHGEEWQSWVRRLLPREHAEEVLAEQGEVIDVLAAAP